ncbi:hypothetical protein JTB14_007014 [Gonioctena quinquepunctata]|nr:hypothetical protein JTB14_007014 [Gonioctena quinquepunctata]
MYNEFVILIAESKEKTGLDMWKNSFANVLFRLEKRIWWKRATKDCSGKSGSCSRCYISRSRDKSLIVCTHHKALKRDCDEVDVYNCSRGDHSPLHLREMRDVGADIIWISPLSQILWYPNVSITNCCLLPGYIVEDDWKKTDVVCSSEKNLLANIVLVHFMRMTWKFVNIKCYELYNQLSEEDKLVFGVSEKHLSWNREDFFRFYKNGGIGVALYVFKEGFDFTGEKSLKNIWRLWLLDRIIKSIAFVIALWFFTVKWNILGIFFRSLEDYISCL